VENFVRVKKRREMSSAKYFVPHRSDLIETYVSYQTCLWIRYCIHNTPFSS
jgi:hypothetical protein